jgi:hypothetical protein
LKDGKVVSSVEVTQDKGKGKNEAKDKVEESSDSEADSFVLVHKCGGLCL